MVLTKLIILSLFIGAAVAQYDCEFDSKFPMQIPGVCGNFFVCHKGDRLEYLCRQNLLFNSYTKQCSPQEDVLCLPPRDVAGQICVMDAPTTFQTDPESCNHYTSCIDGFNYQLKCADDLFFNQDIGACDLAANVKCSGESTAFTSTSVGVPNATLCPSGADNSFQAHPENCTKYFNCISDLYYEYDCPTGAHFNSTSKSCDTVESANCTISTPNLDCLEGSPSHPQADPNDCGGFYICYNGNKLNYICHEDHIFNNDTLLCDIYSPGGCPLEDKCKGQDNYSKFPHETDCAKYYKCLDDISYEIICPADLQFNSVTKRCEKPEHSNCNLGDTTTTDDVTTSTEVPTMTTEEITTTTEEITTTTEEITTTTEEITTTTEEITTTTEEITTTTEEITTTTEEITTTTEEIITTAVPGPCTGVPDYVKVPHEEDCRSFYICIDNEVGYLSECPIPFVFDSRTNQCVKVSDSDCQTIVCEDFQKYPDSESCNKYYQCMGNTFLEASCPEPLHYNVRRGICDDKQKAGCFNNNV